MILVEFPIPFDQVGVLVLTIFPRPRTSLEIINRVLLKYRGILDGRYLQMDLVSLGIPLAIVVKEEKGAIFLDRSANVATELVKVIAGFRAACSRVFIVQLHDGIEGS